MSLLELIKSKPNDFQKELKKAFMPYSANIIVDGAEKETLIILINLSCRKPHAKDLLDISTAKDYIKSDGNIEKAVNEIKWLHSHNLKYPDARVSNQRILALNDLDFLSAPFGWSHNAADFAHPIWLISPFCWQGKTTSVIHLLHQNDPFWSKLFSKIGLIKPKQALFQEEIAKQLAQSSFPDCVSSYSVQLRFPYQDDYLAITPVINHAMQASVQQASRKEETPLKFSRLMFPRSSSISNLCGSVGGNMKFIYAPISCSPQSYLTLSGSKARNNRYFDDYALTNKRLCSVFASMIGENSLTHKHSRQRHRKTQLQILRKQIGLWLMPLIELREHLETHGERASYNNNDELIHRFILLDEADFILLIGELNQRIHDVLLSSDYTRRFAYHPQLFKAVKSQLAWILKKLSEEFEDVAAQEQYIYLRGMRADQINGMSCPLIVGAPAMTAIFGFMHNFEMRFKKLSKEQVDICFEHFAFFVRSDHHYTSAKLTEPNQVRLKRELSDAKRPTIRSNVYSDVEFDLIIKVKTSLALDDYLAQLKASLPATFCGGSLHPPSTTLTDWINVHHSRFVLHQHIKSLPLSGRWLIPAIEQINTIEDIEYALTEDEAYLPIGVGYRLLETPKERKNATTSLHAYVENIIGIAKRVNPMRYRISHRNQFFNHAFWQLKTDNNAILITKQEA